MKNYPLFSIVGDVLDRMFVTDKSGKNIFFPWGSSKQGYYIKNKKLVEKVKRFYKASFFICFVLLVISLSLFDNIFWGIIGSMIVCFSGWYLAYFLYVSRIVKSLKPAKIYYNEIILASYEPEDSENENSQEQPETQFPAQWSNPIYQVNNDPFLGIKRIWYRLSPAQLSAGFFFVGILIPFIWMTYYPQVSNEGPQGTLIIFFLCFFWGLSSFIVAKEGETSKENVFIFYRWKLPAIIATISFWVLALTFLFKYFASILK